MPRLSLTDFVDIVSTAGTPKSTRVKQVKHRPAYEPAFDYYKRLRDHILYIHKKKRPKTELNRILSDLPPNKKENYQEIVDGYKKWWGKKKLEWFKPPDTIYTEHGIEVRINPELGLHINGTPHLIKLYFKAHKLSKFRVEIITHIMKSALTKDCPADTKMSVIDIRNSKLITPTTTITGLDATLNAELAYVAALWGLV